MRVCLAAFLALVAISCNGPETDELDAVDEREGVTTGAVAAVEPGGKPEATVAGYPATSACAETEGTIFSCKIRDGQTIAVCVSRDEQGREFAQYRFGNADEKPELAWPTSFAESGVEWASVPYSGGGEAQLSFARGDIRYVIYSRIIRTNFESGEPNNPEFEDGAYVYRGNRRISELPCAGEADRPIAVAMAERFAQQQNELFTE